MVRPRRSGYGFVSARAVQHEPMKHHRFGLQSVELDLRQMALGDLAPAVHAGLGFQSFAAVQAAQEFTGVVARSYGSNGGTSERFHGVAAQKLVPIMVEEIARREDVAPGNFAAVGYHDSNNTLALQAGRRAGEAALYFGNEIINRNANTARLVNFFVGFGVRVASDGVLQAVRGGFWRGNRRRGLSSRAAADGIPHLRLCLIHGSLLAATTMDNGEGGSQLCTCWPAAGLERKSE